MNAGEAGGQAVTKVLTLPRRAFTPPHSREHPYVVTAPRAGALMPQGAFPLRPSGGGDRACRGCAFCLAASPNRTFFRFTFSLWRLRRNGGLGEVDAPDSPSSVVLSGASETAWARRLPHFLRNLARRKRMEPLASASRAAPL